MAVPSILPSLLFIFDIIPIIIKHHFAIEGKVRVTAYNHLDELYFLALII